MWSYANVCSSTWLWECMYPSLGGDVSGGFCIHAYSRVGCGPQPEPRGGTSTCQAIKSGYFLGSFCSFVRADCGPIRTENPRPRTK